MKKLEAKKTNNKGFSLVELIIVIAIMAVLMVVLAPQLLRYVESSRLQRDNSGISEIANAIEIACANENIAEEIPAAGGTALTITVTRDGNGNQILDLDSITGAPNLSAELAATLGAEVTTSSRTYREAATALSITIISGANGTLVIEADNWANVVDTATVQDQPL